MQSKGIQEASRRIHINKRILSEEHTDGWPQQMDELNIIYNNKALIWAGHSCSKYGTKKMKFCQELMWGSSWQ